MVCVCVCVCVYACSVGGGGRLVCVFTIMRAKKRCTLRGGGLNWEVYAVGGESVYINKTLIWKTNHYGSCKKSKDKNMKEDEIHVAKLFLLTPFFPSSKENYNIYL